ncbi:MAG: VOC family protein [Ilumatobacteraceae bacterium]
MLIADIHHVSLNVTDTERALGFYRDLLGLGVLNVPRSFAGAWLDAGRGRQVHLIESPSIPDDVGQHVAFTVHDLDAAIDTIRAAGYDVPTPSTSPTATPARRSCSTPTGIGSSCTSRHSARDRGAWTRRSRVERRLVSIPALVVIAVGSTVTVPVWLPLVTLADLVRGRFRLPMARLGAFGVCWAWIELAGVTRTFVAWITGRAGDQALHYELMRWWADLLMSALAATTGIRPRLEQPEQLAGGNAIVLSRHASLADSLLSAWAIRGRADLLPRYVLKKELLADPCLDIVGQRIPNHFLDRQAADSAAELDALRARRRRRSGRRRRHLRGGHPGERRQARGRSRRSPSTTRTEPSDSPDCDACCRRVPPGAGRWSRRRPRPTSSWCGTRASTVSTRSARSPAGWRVCCRRSDSSRAVSRGRRAVR